MFSFVAGLSWTLRSPLRWGGWSLVSIVIEPVLFGIIQRIDHFRHQLILLSDLKHGTSILVAATIVSC